MWVYKLERGEDYVVGFYDPNGEWHAIRPYATESAAAKRVHYLNGGNWEGREEDT